MFLFHACLHYNSSFRGTSPKVPPNGAPVPVNRHYVLHILPSATSGQTSISASLLSQLSVSIPPRTHCTGMCSSWSLLYQYVQIEREWSQTFPTMPANLHWTIFLPPLLSLACWNYFRTQSRQGKGETWLNPCTISLPPVLEARVYLGDIAENCSFPAQWPGYIFRSSLVFHYS